MRAHLEQILLKLQAGNETALVIDPRTLEEILLELQGMCQQGDGIIVEPRIGHPGFKIKADPAAAGGAADNPYVMSSQATVGGGATAYNDTWTAADGGTTNGTDAVAGDFDGVQWAGPRLNITSDSTVEIEDSGADAVPGITTSIRIFSRTLTYDTAGKLVSISAEAMQSDSIIQLDGNFALP